MKEQTASDVLSAAETLQLPSRDDSFVELAQEINELITRRAYELFASRGFTHGYDREDWLRAQSEILLNVPVEMVETETGITVRADVPGFTEKDVEVTVAPRSLCIAVQRQEPAEPQEGRTVLSERSSGRIFRVLDLPCQIDPDKLDATLSEGLLEIKLATVGLWQPRQCGAQVFRDMSSQEAELSFSGVRGSTPTVDRGTLRYGGNTPFIDTRVLFNGNPNSRGRH